MPEILLYNERGDERHTYNTDLLHRLRTETREVHQALERDLDLTQTAGTIANYRRLLERFYGFYQPFEPAAMDALPPQLLSFFEPRIKVPRLIKDLQFLGSHPGHVEICPRLPALRGVAVLGGFYVMEGATLGGQLISRHLEQALGLKDGNGYAFFSSYGQEVGAMWRGFREMLIEQSSTSADDAIVRGATDTFHAMHAWLCRG